MASQAAQPVEVFFSYSHKDEELRDYLATHLIMLKREGVIREWHDRRITAGREWGGEIDARLGSADVILLLVSPDFLASDYCYDVEVERAMHRHEAGEARVIPIILRACDWTRTPFSRLHALPKDAKPVTRWEDRDEALLDIATGIRLAAAELMSDRTAAPPPLGKPTKPVPRLHVPDILRVPFVMRQDREGNDIVERLKAELAPHKNRLIALWGAGGVGKTAIAVESARALIDDFDQRVVWVGADGREDFNLATLLDAVAAQLGHADLRKLSLDSKKEQVHEVLMTAPTLVILDNFETITPEEANHCTEWLLQTAPCSALITTRQHIEGARNIPINPMTLTEAHNLLERLITEVHDQRAFVNFDRERVINTAEANPLVLQWIVGQIDLAQAPEEVLSELAHGEGTAAQRVFDRSYNLPQLAAGGRGVLLALSLFVPSATRSALSEVAGMDNEKNRKRFKEAVKNLSALWLIRTTEDQRLAVEGLTRELTKARLSTDPRSKSFRQRFVSRFRKYTTSHQKPIPSDLNTIEAEMENILAAIDIAFDTKDWRGVMTICDPLKYFFALRGYWDEAIRRGEQAMEAAQSMRDEFSASVFAANTGQIRLDRGEYKEAQRVYKRALDTSKKFAVTVNVVASLIKLATISLTQGDYAEAKRLCEEALESGTKLGNQESVAAALCGIGHVLLEQGQTDEAKRMIQDSLAALESASDQTNRATIVLMLGRVAQSQNDYSEARRCYEEGLELSKKLYNQQAIAASLQLLGALSIDEGDLEGGGNLLDESAVTLRKLGAKYNLAECLESIGILMMKRERFTEAHDSFKEALEIAEASYIPFRIGSVKHSLGLLAERQGDSVRAATWFREAVNIFEEIGADKLRGARQSLKRVEGEPS